MVFRSLVVSAVLLGIHVGAPLAARTPLPAQTATRPANAVTSRVTVILPQEDAELIVDGETVPGEGTSRTFQTAPRPAGSTRAFTFTAQWKPNGYTTMTRTKTVSSRAGAALRVDLSVEAPGDRVRVIYVPTPTDVALEMVRLAGVTGDDVVYEPGCGDARVTIAAIQRGARRAICVDIEPERAEESRANVRKAGLEDRIDVRLGDALDVKDLSDVTVVFLYMGDHFNMLIRPVLWRDLKIGARIVSHRFAMGDWEPDRTVTVNSDEGGEYTLHLWTVTAEIKRRLSTAGGRR
jgi:uncharacterized protein (TIGR03000 family)